MTSHDFISKEIEKYGIYGVDMSYVLIYCRRCGFIVRDYCIDRTGKVPPSCITEKKDE
jgi:hypothetical protein